MVDKASLEIITILFVPIRTEETPILEVTIIILTETTRSPVIDNKNQEDSLQHARFFHPKTRTLYLFDNDKVVII